MLTPIFRPKIMCTKYVPRYSKQTSNENLHFGYAWLIKTYEIDYGFNTFKNT